MTAPAIAFAATDLGGARKRLRSRNVKFRESIVPRTGDTQIFLYDPDGVGLELNFPGIGSPFGASGRPTRDGGSP